ncbi:MAG: carboxy terminal-processing peptidase [Ferruginibacter sp.]
MHQIASFIMSKKFIPVVLCLLLAGLFIAFQSQGKGDINNENPKSKYEKILRNVNVLLREGHYSPKNIDDQFSSTVFDKFLGDLDNDKNVLLKSDVENLAKYRTAIDDELKGADLESFFAVNNIYLKRQNEVASFYKDFLDKPFEFSGNESLQLDADKLDFPANEAARREAWRLRMKYLTLDKYVAMQNEREKNKDKKDFKVKTDKVLEQEARDAVKKQMERWFATKKSRETNDENFSTFMNAITGVMDPHTSYFLPIDLRSFNETMRGGFFGIGAQLKDEDGKIKIGSLVTGAPAWKNGELKENDEIIKVAQGKAEPVDITGYAVTDAVKLIRGAKGSEVRLTVKRMDGTIKVISIIREDIKLEDVFVKSAIINGAHKIGYIYLPEFYADFENPNGPRCAVDVARELEKLKAEKVEGIVLDLRGNGGGSLYDVVQMAGLFIPDGPICQVKGREDKPNILRDRDRNVQYDGPLTVLVDETSASASEIFAAAIQDYKRGIVIGSTSTYGKGTVQRNIPLNPVSENALFTPKKTDDLGTVKLTLQKFYRINGDATQLKGVVPDVVLPDRLEYIKFREKDNPNSLKWDEIEKASYQTWTSNFSTPAVISSANEDVNKSATFNKIKTDVQWLEKNNDKAYSLNIVQFKQDQQNLKNIYKNIEELYKLPVPMKIRNLGVDTSAINLAKEKVDRNKLWLKAVSNDIYIDESVKITNKMIQQNNVAKIENAN